MSSRTPLSRETQTILVPRGRTGKQERPEWDTVSEASWQSFPASDPPAWIGGAIVTPDERSPR